jgi:hypothetical protein
VTFWRGTTTPPLPHGCQKAPRDSSILPKIVSFPALVHGAKGVIATGPQGPQYAPNVLSIRPGKIPSGIGLFLAPQVNSGSFAWNLQLVQANTACTGS